MLLSILACQIWDVLTLPWLESEAQDLWKAFAQTVHLVKSSNKTKC